VKRFVLVLIALSVLAAPAAASADLTITNLHRDAATDQDSQAGLIWFAWTKPTSALTSYNVYVDGALWWDHPDASATREWVGSYSWPCGTTHTIGIEAVDGSTVGPRATQAMTNKACAAPPPPPPPPPSGSGPSWDPNGTYTSTFVDEFNGTAVDTAKWETGWFGTGITNRANSSEDDCYSSANVSESGGFLHLLLTAVHNTCSSGTQPYTGALVNTRRSFTRTFGSYEARVCMPDSNADGRVDGWPAWWMNGVDPPSWPAHGEIDIAEGRHGTVASHLHYLLNGADANAGFTPASPYTGCHTFGVRWASGTATLYYDGVQVWTHAFTATTPEYLIFDYAVDVQLTGSAIIPGSELTVDWVRAWS
jgi:hypothetical protein